MSFAQQYIRTMGNRRKQHFMIHDNESIPHIVTIQNAAHGKRVSVFKLPDDIYDDDLHLMLSRRSYYKLFSELMASYTASKVFVPRGYVEFGGQDKFYKGNTILLKISRNRYVYIGGMIYEFSTMPNDEIVKYYSIIGPSVVPYPVAIGLNYVYFLSTKTYLPIDMFKDLDEVELMDSYSYYYGHKKLPGIRRGPLKKYSKRIPHVRMVYARTA